MIVHNCMDSIRYFVKTMHVARVKRNQNMMKPVYQMAEEELRQIQEWRDIF